MEPLVKARIVALVWDEESDSIGGPKWCDLPEEEQDAIIEAIDLAAWQCISDFVADMVDTPLTEYDDADKED